MQVRRRADAARAVSLQKFTYLRDTLNYVKSSIHKNVTLSLPEPLLRQFRVYAATRNQSMTHLMADAIRQMTEGGEAATAKARFLERIRSAPDRRAAPKGRMRWTRDELHER